MSIFNRGSSYYLVYNVPKDKIKKVGKKQIWISLKTTDLKIAKTRYQFIISNVVKTIFSAKNNYMKNPYTVSDELINQQILNDIDRLQRT